MDNELLKWRRRWFVLRHSGDIPGQYILEYYTDHSCRKLKGQIDLDQCEQVDVGWASETRKCAYDFVFDIRTPKRTYFLAAETDQDMNRWVDCICSVCHLKIDVKEELSPSTDTHSMSIISLPPSSRTTVTAEEHNLLAPFQYDDAESTLSTPPPPSPSGPYIPISECISGSVPVVNGIISPEDLKGGVDAVPPPPPKGSMRNLDRTFHSQQSGEWYDYPRQIHPPGLDTGRNSPTPSAEELYKVPSSLNREKTSSPPTVPPKVNWDTYPRHGMASRNEINRSPLTFSPLVCESEYDVLPTVTLSSVDDATLPLRSNISPHEGQRNPSPLPKRHEDQLTPSPCPSPHAPPRPPKPAHLSECLNISQDFDDGQSLYDIPPSAQGVFLSKNLPASAFAYLKTDIDLDDLVSPPSSLSTPDVMYDFPRSLQDDKLHATPPAPSSDFVRQWRHAYINAPAGYLNDDVGADVNGITDGHVNNIRGGMSTNGSSGGTYYLSMNLPTTPAPLHINDVYTDMSGGVIGNSGPNVQCQAVYSNIPSPTRPNASSLGFIGTAENSSGVLGTPPTVNRELKPKKNADPVLNPLLQSSWSFEHPVSNPCTSPKATQLDIHHPPLINRELKPKRAPPVAQKPAGFVLSQPPSAGSMRALKTKKSFRKDSKITSSPAGHGHSTHTLTNTGMLQSNPCSPRSDLSSSEDDQSSSGGSRRNSSHEEPASVSRQGGMGKSAAPPPDMEIQYLDLDLESDTSAQSPKSSERVNTNTVYKTVDFVKTKAFNETRQGVEESYRKSH